MRTTLDLPKDLINQGLKETGLASKTALITTAVEELIRKRRIVKLKDFKGRVNLKIDLNKLRKR